MNCVLPSTTVTQVLVDASSAAKRQSNGSVAREIERAVTWPVNQAIAEAVGFDTLAQGTHPDVLRVHNAMQAVSGPIDAAVRERIRRPSRLMRVSHQVLLDLGAAGLASSLAL
ncbi:MAG TPA: hypothetical protein VE197_18710 [Mycobacterium sp.]|nr:hypothetical protein [Mycobacterium sp.]